MVSAPGAWGQENPFGPSAPDAPPAAATDEEAEKVSEFDKLVAAEQDPLVRAVLEAKPTTPAAVDSRRAHAVELEATSPLPRST